MLIAGLCNAYHWSYDEAMRLTLPQILMLNHAASYNWKRSEAHAKIQVEIKKSAEKKEQQKNDKDPIVDVNGRKKRLSELTTDEFVVYYGS